MDTKTEKGSDVVVTGGEYGRIIPPSTPLERLHYFDGKFLRAPDLMLEQEALLAHVHISNQAGGSGVVHGLTCAVSGGKLTIDPGLAIDPAGRLLFLPEAEEREIAPLLDAGVDLTSKFASDKTGFGDCVEKPADVSAGSVPVDGFYVILAFHAQAFCGTEDVYGKLCETACVSETERPYVREGVTIRAIRVNLHLPPSNLARDAKYQRSRAASAWFRANQGIRPSLINREGLNSGFWCRGAELDLESSILPALEQGVPLALLSYKDGSVHFLDNWIARRERMEPRPRQYWAGRMAMRPWSVYMAEVLQFQCQLSEEIVAGGGQLGAGVLAVSQPMMLKESLKKIVVEANKPSMAKESSATLLGAVDEMNTCFGGMSQTGVPSQTLIDHGIVELPSAGWLPVDPQSNWTVNEQVRALVGNGVDLRFCAVRPDYCPHAFEEAQHMERISLLQGIDPGDSSSRPKVDILVPNGRVDKVEVPKSESNELRIYAQDDWVLFHRRRTRTCEADTPVHAPLPNRVYRVYRIETTTEDEAESKISDLRNDLLQIEPDEPPEELLAEFAPGGQALRSVRDILQESWTDGLETNSEIFYGAIASQGGAVDDGDALAEARLENLVSVLDDVSPTAEAALLLERLDTYPSEWAPGDVDGVIVLVTLVPEQGIETVCHEVYRVEVSRDEANDKWVPLLNEDWRGEVLGDDRFKRLTDASFANATADLVDGLDERLTRDWGELGDGIPYGVVLIVAGGDTTFGIPADQPYLDQVQAIVATTGGTPGTLQPYNIFPQDGYDDCPAVTILFVEPGYLSGTIANVKTESAETTMIEVRSLLSDEVIDLNDLSGQIKTNGTEKLELPDDTQVVPLARIDFNPEVAPHAEHLNQLKARAIEQGLLTAEEEPSPDYDYAALNAVRSGSDSNRHKTQRKSVWDTFNLPENMGRLTTAAAMPSDLDMVTFLIPRPKSR